MTKQAKILIAALSVACVALGGLLLVQGRSARAESDEVGSIAPGSLEPAVEPAPLAAAAPRSDFQPAARVSRGEPRREPARAAEREERSLAERVFAPRTETVHLASGTRIPVRLESAFSSREMRGGDVVGVELARDLVADGRVVAHAGSRGTARVAWIDHSDRVKGREKMELTLVDLVIAGDARSIETEPVLLVAKGTKKRDAAIIGGSAAAGAILGAITGGDDGAAKGAVIGGAGGTGVVLGTKGEDIDLPAGHVLTFTLAEELAVEVDRDAPREESSPDVSRR